MTQPRRIPLDFAAPAQHAPRLGAVLCGLGLAAVVTVAIAFNNKLNERAGLDAALAALTQPRGARDARGTGTAEENATIEHELSVPWSKLLAELESASHDSAATVALLQVEPDPNKHTVRITAEARSLPAALAYLERLQKSKVLRYPMLESHERKKDDPEHPVRVKLTAEWRS